MPSPRRRSDATLFLAPTPRLCNYGRGFMVFLDKRLAIGHRARVRQRSRAHAKLRSGRRGMISLRMVGPEVSALGAAALSMAKPLPPEELAIFAAADPVIPPPHPIYGPHSGPRQRGGRVVVVPECGHWGLLIHPAVLREAAGFLAFPGATPQLAEQPLALGAAS